MASLVLIKPDAIQHRLLGWCLAVFENYGIRDIRMTRMDEALCDAHYAEHREKPFYPGLKEFMLSGPVVALAMTGSVQIVRQAAMDIRDNWPDYVDGPRNLVHSSDSILSAEHELDLWFPNWVF